jgi:hypothetical protein
MTDSRRIAVPAYVIGIVLMVIPIADIFASLYPWRVMEPRWRFGAVGLVSNALLIPTAGLLIVYLTATLLEHRMARRVLGITALAAGILAFATIVLFSLDALQTRAAVRPELQQNFGTVAAAAAIKLLVLGAACVVIAAMALFGGKASGASQSRLPLFSQPGPMLPKENR